MESDVDNSAEDMRWHIKPAVTNVSTIEVAELLGVALREIHDKISLIWQ